MTHSETPSSSGRIYAERMASSEKPDYFKKCDDGSAHNETGLTMKKAKYIT